MEAEKTESMRAEDSYDEIAPLVNVEDSKDCLKSKNSHLSM